MVLKKSIILKKYAWHKSESVAVAGFCWNGTQFYEGSSFADYIFKKSKTCDIFLETLKLLNGQFSVVVEKQSEIWAATSHTWSFPIFYHQSEEELILSDNADIVLEKIKTKNIDGQSKNYFLMFGVTPQNRTLIQDLIQIKPAELLIFSDSSVQSFSLLENKNNVSLKAGTEEELHDTILMLFTKYYDVIKDKQVLLPLTSGYDSRLLACLLKQFGHKNVLCSTWGRKGNVEVATAQKVAQSLGYKHFFVEYNSKLISGFSKNEKFINYFNFAGHLSSMPFLQDYFAIDYLIENKVIDAETIVLPGHSGDYFAGSHLTEETENAKNSGLFSRILEKCSCSYPLNSHSLKEIETHINDWFFLGESVAPWQKFEKWDFQERQSKLISNSNQVYLYKGLNFMMPLFDKEFISFFDKIPFSQKLNADFYNSTLENKFFAPQNVLFDLKGKQHAKSNFPMLKKLILKLTPHLFKKFYYPMNDAIFYNEITSELILEMEKYKFRHPSKPHAFNSYLIQWYLYQLEKNLAFYKTK